MVKQLCTLLTAALCVLPHEFHVSITQIAHNDSSGQLELAVKVFTDDLEAAIQPKGTEPLRLGTDREDARSKTLIGVYINRNLRVKADGVPVVLTFLGKETEADATWCYFESGPLGKISQLEVTNTMLLDLFDDQVNITHFKHQGKTKAGMTNRDRPSQTFQ